MNSRAVKPKIHFITGKGGVGKSEVARSLAMSLARQKKTLLATIREAEHDVHTSKIATPQKKTDHLYEVAITPEAALMEYLHLKLPKKLVKMLLGKDTFNRLCSAMPGLPDLTRLGKIWFHADAQHGHDLEIFDKIVVDMPSSGFVPRFLSIAKTVSEAVLVGPLAKEAKMINDFLRQGNALVHIVAIPEELVVNESIELIKNIERSCDVPVGAIIFNRVLDFDAHGYAACQDAFKDKSELKKIGTFFWARYELEQEPISTMRSYVGKKPIVTIKEHVGESVEDMKIEEMALLGGAHHE